MPKLMEIIEFLDDSGDTMVQRIPENGSGEFKFGAQLIVRESQKAVFFRDGKALDIFSVGRHILKTQNIPALTKLVTSLGYGSDSPFKSEVYFLNMKLFRNLKWGTKEPILFRDTELKMIRLRGYGVFSITIKEPSLFLNKVVGTQGLFRDSDISDYLKSLIIQKLHTILGHNLKTVFDLPQHFDNFSILIKNVLQLEFEGLGLELNDFLINSISVPPEVQKIIDTRTGMSAVGSIDEFMKFQMGQSLEKAAENPSGAAGISTGIGMGFMVPEMMKKTIENQTKQSDNSEANSLSKLKILKELLDIKAISEEEYNEAKKRILNNL